MSNDRKNCIAVVVFLFVVSLVTYFMVEWLQGTCPNPLGLNFWLNLLVYTGVTALLYGLTCRIFACVLVPMLIFGLLGAANHFMIAIRGKALLPWDFFALTTAQNVADGMSLSFDVAIVAAVVITVLTVLVAWRFRHVRLPGRSRMVASLIGVVFLSAIWMILWHPPGSVSSDPWYTASASKQNGMAVNLVHNVKSLINLPPEGYSSARVREIVGNGAREGERAPDIIVIMNETFADLSSIADLQTNEDPLSFFHSLSENTIRGNARVSVFGGGTCNTEYDFLTGNSSMLLRSGSYPMVQFVTGESHSLASMLKNHGYRTIGIHPFYPDGWNRDNAYPLLGFDEFISNRDFENPEMIREYISDAESFRRVISELDKSDEPAFIFNVTMQNHFGYDKAFDNLNENIDFPDSDKFPQTKRYLSLLSYTDRAFKELVDVLRERKRPTILLMFGDHLPSIEEEYYDVLQQRAGISDELMDEKKHTVPFLIWANFPIEDKKDIDVSVSYLAPILLDAADAPMSAHHSFLFNLMQSMPIIKNDGSVFSEEYRMVSHNMVFDSFDRQDDLFS